MYEAEQALEAEKQKDEALKEAEKKKDEAALAAASSALKGSIQ